jgi:DNA-binding CsgD family transcriptional regulator
MLPSISTSICIVTTQARPRLSSTPGPSLSRSSGTTLPMTRAFARRGQTGFPKGLSFRCRGREAVWALSGWAHQAKAVPICIVIQAIGLACYYHLERYYGPPPPSSPHLTEREREILNLVAQGLSSSAIARTLRLSERTVEWHVKQAMKKLDAKNRIQAVVLAIRDGLIAP